VLREVSVDIGGDEGGLMGHEGAMFRDRRFANSRFYP
jgi:hypothetical protein